LGTLHTIRQKIRQGLYVLTGHAEDEKESDGLTTRDIERAILWGRMEMAYTHDPRGPRHEIVGESLDGRKVHVVCRQLTSGKVRIITVWTEE